MISGLLSIISSGRKFIIDLANENLFKIFEILPINLSFSILKLESNRKQEKVKISLANCLNISIKSFEIYELFHELIDLYINDSSQEVRNIIKLINEKFINETKNSSIILKNKKNKKN